MDLAINQEIEDFVLLCTLYTIYIEPRGYAHQSFPYRTDIHHKDQHEIYLTTQLKLPTLYGQFTNNQ